MAYTYKLTRAAAQIHHLTKDAEHGAVQGGEWQYVSYFIELREEMSRLLLAHAHELAEEQRQEQLSMLKDQSRSGG